MLDLVGSQIAGFLMQGLILFLFLLQSLGSIEILKKVTLSKPTGNWQENGIPTDIAERYGIACIDWISSLID